MLSDHLVFLLAMALFAASAVWLVYKGAAFSPQFIVALTFLAMGFEALAPQMKFSDNRQYTLGMRTQVFVLLAAATFLGTIYFVKRPKLRDEYPRLRWKYLPRLAWLALFFSVCLADPIVSFLLYGKVGLVQGNQGMGSGGGNHSDVFTPLTFIAWSCNSMAMAMLMTDFLFSFKGFLPYLKKRMLDVALVVGCTMCTALSGNRFVMICQLLSLMLGLALFSRLKPWMVATMAVFLGLFFIIVGNFRFGTLNVVDSLEKVTGVASVDMVDAWAVTYSEPTFPNLDNFLRDQPAMLCGMGWVTSVLPSGLVDAMGMNRVNSAEWFSDNILYAYHGLTFRTMYPDLIMDFGFKGALILGALFFYQGVRIYNRSLLSPYHFVLFLAFSPMVLFAPLVAAFYFLPNLTTFAILLLVVKQKPRKKGPPPFDPTAPHDLEEAQDEPLLLHDDAEVSLT